MYKKFSHQSLHLESIPPFWCTGLFCALITRTLVWALSLPNYKIDNRYLVSVIIGIWYRRSAETLYFPCNSHRSRDRKCRARDRKCRVQHGPVLTDIWNQFRNWSVINKGTLRFRYYINLCK